MSESIISETNQFSDTNSSTVHQAELAKVGVNIDEIVRQAYDGARRLHGSDLADADIATTDLYGHEVASFITRLLLRPIAIGGTPLRACAEVHALDEDIVSAYCYTTVGYPDEKPSDHTIVDATYKRFIDADSVASMPNVFIGPREEMIAVMQQHARDPLVHRLYLADTLQLPATRILAANKNLPVARHCRPGFIPPSYW